MKEPSIFMLAYHTWRKFKAVGLCKCVSHYDVEKLPNEKSMVIPEPDDNVCATEIAWRRYCEIRDGKMAGYYSCIHEKPRKTEYMQLIRGGKFV